MAVLMLCSISRNVLDLKIKACNYKMGKHTFRENSASYTKSCDK
uniref:Uncharacterized protein n=1 Tax=Romanomermis culicivorax TaxID=13658 RepID=A0A915KKK5_ROMCU